MRFRPGESDENIPHHSKQTTTQTSFGQSASHRGKVTTVALLLLVAAAAGVWWMSHSRLRDAILKEPNAGASLEAGLGSQSRHGDGVEGELPVMNQDGDKDFIESSGQGNVDSLQM